MAKKLKTQHYVLQLASIPLLLLVEGEGDLGWPMTGFFCCKNISYLEIENVLFNIDFFIF